MARAEKQTAADIAIAKKISSNMILLQPLLQLASVSRAPDYISGRSTDGTTSAGASCPTPPAGSATRRHHSEAESLLGGAAFAEQGMPREGDHRRSKSGFLALNHTGVRPWCEGNRTACTQSVKSLQAEALLLQQYNIPS